MRVLRLIRRFAVLLVFLGMLALNIASLTVGAVATMASAVLSAFKVPTLVETPALARRRAAEGEDLRRRNAALSAELDLERDQAARLTADRDGLDRRASLLQADLDDSRRRLGELDIEARDLRGRNAALDLDLDRSRNELRVAQEARDRVTGQLDDVLRRMSARTATTASANLGATMGEAVPFYGVGIIFAATAYEMWSACESMKDMREMSLLLGLPDDAEATSRVCGLKVPERAEIWAAVRSSPGAIWQAAQSAVSGAVDGVAGFEMPDFEMPAGLVPGFSLPEFSLPEFSLPEFALPGLSLPEISLPDLSLPTISAPDLSGWGEWMPDLWGDGE